MTKTTMAVPGALLAAIALLSAAPAQAAAHRVTPGNWLYVTVTTGDARSSHISSRLLTCDPPHGHAHAARACEELAAADGDITRIPPKHTFCPMIYAPVTADAHGEWNGRQVEYSHAFGNACALEGETGAVFALSEQAPDGPTPGLRR
ncbi:SSI family serine proteinase inhibitor [Streptomyces avermitilis]